MAASVVLYCGLAVVLIGALSLLCPLQFIGIRTRRAAAAVACAGLMLAVAALAWPAPATKRSPQFTRLDEFMPVWQVNERHAIHVDAAPERVFESIRAVRADEITLFHLLTWIRRAGRPGPESIINAPGQKPLLDVATHTSFLMLADDAPRELVLGTVIIAPREARQSGRLSPELFKRRLRPGVALATMNFLVAPDGRGGSELSTETRVYANDEASLRAFTIYWRFVSPGSDIIRRMWLRAIRTRAERAGKRGSPDSRIGGRGRRKDTLSAAESLCSAARRRSGSGSHDAHGRRRARCLESRPRGGRDRFGSITGPFFLGLGHVISTTTIHRRR